MSATQLAKKKVICNAKAQAIVEKLIDGVETETSLLTELRWINQNHYQDIIEERAIMKTCGYPLCCQKLVHVPKKQYSIILSLSKVYDISQRKHFCSNQCYKASCYLKEQLLETPLWTRDSEPEPKFTLLKSSKELLGDEISFSVHRVRPSNAEMVFENDSPSISSQEANNLEIKEPVHLISLKPTTENVRMTHERINPIIPKTADVEIVDEIKTGISEESSPFKTSEELSTSTTTLSVESCHDTYGVTNVKSHRNENVSSPMPPTETALLTKGASINSNEKIPLESTIDNRPVNSIMKHVITEDKNNAGTDTEARISEKSKVKKSKTASTRRHEMCEPSIAKDVNELVLHVEKSLREWFTIDSLCCVIGFEKVKELMLDKGKKLEDLNTTKSDPYFYERYNTLCKKLKILQLQENKFQNDIVNYDIPSKPLPDFNVLREQTKEMEIKVKAFFRGDKKVMFEEQTNKTEGNEERLVIPLLHHHAKNAIRRNLVLDKLKTTIPAFASILQIPNFDISDKIKRLIFTFKFSAHNIVFKPLEWNLIILILLKLLSLQDFHLKERLDCKSDYINAMLLNYELENNYLDLICTWLTDLDSILVEQEPE